MLAGNVGYVNIMLCIELGDVSQNDEYIHSQYIYIS